MAILNNISIQTKSLIGFFAIFLMVILISYLGIANVTNLGRVTETIINNDAPRLQALIEAKSAASEIETLAISFQSLKKESVQFEGSPLAIKKYQLLASMEQLNKWKNEYQHYQQTSNQQEQQFLNMLSDKQNEITLLSLSLIDLKEKDATEEVITAKTNDLNQAVTDLKKLINEKVDNELQNFAFVQATTKSSIQDTTRFSIALSAGAFIITLLVALLLARSILKPIGELRAAAQRITSGNLDQHIVTTGKDELGDLATAFNHMTTQLKQSYQVLEEKVKERTAALEKIQSQLKTTNVDLEEKVAVRTKDLEELKNNLEIVVSQRTAELNKKIVELELANKLMVGRELKMVDLKKKIEELEKDKTA